MRRAGLTAALAALALLPGLAAAAPAVYDLDPDHSFVHFEVVHFGTSTTRGRFGPVRGTVTLDPATGRVEIGLRVPSASVSTGIGVFDARLREADLLDSEGYPEVFFVASRGRFDGAHLSETTGEFTWRGTSQPLTLRALSYGCRTEPGPPATEVCGGDFGAEFRRSEFGATFGLPFVADRVRLVVQVEGRRRADTPSPGLRVRPTTQPDDAHR
jgi:polyisoprenoid-binding protein YceI